MLTVDQKAIILEKTGCAVPPFPGLRAMGPETLSVPEIQVASAVTRWKHEIEVLYSYYMAARAAKSLRKAEDAKQMNILREASARIP